MGPGRGSGRGIGAGDARFRAGRGRVLGGGPALQASGAVQRTTSVHTLGMYSGRPRCSAVMQSVLFRMSVPCLFAVLLFICGIVADHLQARHNAELVVAQCLSDCLFFVFCFHRC